MCNLLSHRTNRTFFNALNNFDLVYFLLFLPTFTHLFTVLSQKKARASVLFSIQSEGLVCNQRASRVACNPSLRDGMASRFSAYSRFSAFGLIPYITSWWFHTRLRRNSIQGFALISYTPMAWFGREETKFCRCISARSSARASFRVCRQIRTATLEMFTNLWYNECAV